MRVPPRRAGGVAYLGPSGVPGHSGQLLFGGLPLGAGEEARGDIDQARGELEDARGGPWAAVTGAILADVQGIRHTGEREVLDNHFGQKFESLHFQGIVFQVATVGGNAKAEGDFLGGGRTFPFSGLGRTLPFPLPSHPPPPPTPTLHSPHLTAY